MKRLILLAAFIAAIVTVSAQTAGTPAKAKGLAAGPMVCYGEMREVMVWVQTTAAATVVLQYREQSTSGIWLESAPVRTASETAFTAKLVADQVEPGRHYDYRISLNSKPQTTSYPTQFQTPKLWQWREDPPPLTVAFGSCFYVNETEYDRPGNPYGGDYQIMTALAAKKPDIMLWLGDNTYLREADWYSRTGILRRYSHTRALPELQPLLGATHNYAIWDDHDFGPNDSDRGYRAKDLTNEAFRLFWGNPSYGINGQPGVATTFEWSDVQFFMLDDRTYRTPDTRKTGERRMFGKEQMEWLIDNLITSKATFKIIVSGGQMMNPVAQYETFAIYPEERTELLEAINKENISGVVFVTGDIHHGELTKLDREGTYPLYDLTTSPLTAGVSPMPNGAGPLAIKETILNERNFATLEFTGKKNERVMTMRMFDKSGQERWSRAIRAAELQPEKK